MKIGIVAPDFPPDIGGMPTYAVNLSRELQRRGHKVSVFTNVGIGESNEVHNLTVHRILTRNFLANLKILSSWEMDLWHVINASYCILSLRKSHVFTSVHGKDFVNPWIFPLFRVKVFSRLVKWPYVWRFNWRSLDFSIERLGSKFLLYRGYRKTKRIFTSSSYTAERFNKAFPGNKSRVNVTYVGVEPSFFEVPRRTNQRKKRILTVSRLSRDSTIKNVDKVISALSLLRDKFDFEYWVVGDGTLRSYLEELAHKSGIGDRVRFFGFVSHSALQEIYSVSDIFVLTSSANERDFEGFGIVYIEANAAGIPVLACRQGGAVEAVKEGISGMFVDIPSEKEIADKLAHYLAGKLRFNESEIRQHARRFLWTEIVNDIEQDYFNVMNDKDGLKHSFQKTLNITN